MRQPVDRGEWTRDLGGVIAMSVRTHRVMGGQEILPMGLCFVQTKGELLDIRRPFTSSFLSVNSPNTVANNNPG